MLGFCCATPARNCGRRGQTPPMRDARRQRPWWTQLSRSRLPCVTRRLIPDPRPRGPGARAQAPPTGSPPQLSRPPPPRAWRRAQGGSESERRSWGSVGGEMWQAAEGRGGSVVRPPCRACRLPFPLAARSRGGWSPRPQRPRRAPLGLQPPSPTVVAVCHCLELVSLGPGSAISLERVSLGLLSVR